MSLIDELSPASFKGAGFLIASSSVSGSRKDQLHEFPNSDRQIIEDFGLRARTYNVTGWIGGEDYTAKRDALLAALEDGTTGTLIHPFYGELIDIKCRTFTISENMDELGRAEISMVFDVNNDEGSPIEKTNTLSLIAKSNELAQEAARNAIENDFSVNPVLSGTFDAAKTKIKEMNASFDNASNVVVQAKDEIDGFNSLIGDFSTGINGLIKAPKELADSIKNVSAGLNGLHAVGESQLTAWKSMFGFGDNNVAFKIKTAATIEKEKNDATLSQSMQSQALGYAYYASAQIDFKTTGELDGVSKDLEKQFLKLSKLNLDQALRDSLVDLRENIISFFNQKRLTLSKVIEINTAKLPARVIAFQYYNDSEIGREISDINDDANVTFYSGKIKVVTQ